MFVFLQRFHPEVEIQKKEQKGQTSITSFVGDSVDIPNTDTINLKLQETLLKMIVVDNQPLQMVEGEGFKNLMKLINPKIQIPSRRTVTRKLKTTVDNICIPSFRQEFTNLLPRSINVILDMWTDKRQRSVLGVKVQFIDDQWKLRCIAIGFKHFHGRATGINIRETTASILNTYEIKEEQIITVMADNASNIAKALSCRSFLNGIDGDGPTVSSNNCEASSVNGTTATATHYEVDEDEESDSECDRSISLGSEDSLFLDDFEEYDIANVEGWEQGRCKAHLIQLAINDAIKSNVRVQKLITNVAGVINFFRRSNYWYGELRKLTVKGKGLRCINTTRWNSTYIALERLCCVCC
jgi:hypothetical protein